MPIPLRLSFLLFCLTLSSCHREAATSEKTEKTDSANASTRPEPRATEMERVHPTSWIVNGTGENWGYRLDGGKEHNLPAYAVRPLKLSNRRQEVTVRTPGGELTFSLMHRQNIHTILNPGGHASFVIRSITYSASGIPRGGGGGRRTIQDELIQEPFAFGLTQHVPTRVSLNLHHGLQQNLRKIYVAFPEQMSVEAAREILAGGKAMYMGSHADVCTYLAEQDTPESQTLLEQYAFEEQEPQAAYALFQHGELDVLENRFTDLTEFTQKGIAHLMSRASGKSTAIAEDHLPLLNLGLTHPEIKVRREYMKPALMYLPDSHDLFQLSMKLVQEEKDPRVAKSLDGLLKRREGRLLKEADGATLLAYFQKATGLDTQLRILHRGAWLSPKEEILAFYRYAGTHLGSGMDSAQRDTLYASIREEALTPAWRPEYLDAFTLGALSSSDAAFRNALMLNRVEWGFLDAGSVEYVLKTSPSMLLEPKGETLKGMYKLLRSDRNAKLQMVALVDQMTAEEERQKLIQHLGHSLPYRIPVPEILAVTLEVKDPEFRRFLYEKCKPVIASDLRKGTVSKEITDLVQQEPDPELRKILTEK